MSFTLCYYLHYIIQNRTRVAESHNHISFLIMLLLCLPLFYAYSLHKTCSLSLQWTSTSSSLRRGRSSQSNDALGHMDNVNLLSFHRLFLFSWIVQVVSSDSGHVWLADTFSEDFFLDSSCCSKMMQTMVEPQESLVCLYYKQTAVLV